jgi:membrane-bound inhibitor of C-type lysozyme
VIGVTVGGPSKRGTLDILTGGVASNVTVAGTENSLTVRSGAAATDTILDAETADLVYGSATRTTVSSGATEYVFGGETIAAKVLNGGTESLAAGTVGEGLTVSAGGVVSGPGTLIGADAIHGSASGVAIGGGGVETIW